MVVHSLSPGMVKCQYQNKCSKFSYDKCTTCKNNLLVMERNADQKEKDNYYKRI